MKRIYEGALERIRFTRGELRAFQDDEGRIWVQAKPVAEALGLRWHGSFEKKPSIAFLLFLKPII